MLMLLFFTFFPVLIGQFLVIELSYFWSQGIEFTRMGGMAAFAEAIMDLFTDTQVVRKSSAKQKGSGARVLIPFCFLQCDVSSKDVRFAGPILTGSPCKRIDIQRSAASRCLRY